MCIIPVFHLLLILPSQNLTIISNVVPSPGTEERCISSVLRFMLGNPMPAPNPIWRTVSDAVEKPSCMARPISSMPGPSSSSTILILLASSSTCITPLYACATTFTSASYTATAILRTTWGSILSCLRIFFTSELACPAELKSPPIISYPNCISEDRFYSVTIQPARYFKEGEGGCDQRDVVFSRQRDHLIGYFFSAGEDDTFDIRHFGSP